MNSKKRKAIETSVLQAYSSKYPTWTGVQVTQVVENRVLDTLVAVKSTKYPDGEICIYKGGDVQIFDSTPELMRYVDAKASTVVTYKDLLVGIIVLSMMGIFAGVVFIYKDEHAIGMVTTAMSGILGTFVGVKINAKSDSA